MLEPSLSPLARPNWVEYDLAAITRNLVVIRRGIRAGTKVFAALKGDAYGFGLIPVATALDRAGVEGVAVADVSEAIVLRNAGLRVPILLYAGHVAEDATVRAVVEHRLIPTICDLGEAAAYSRLGGRTVDVFVKVDVGLDRVGVLAEAVPSFLAELRRHPRLAVAGLYTHLHVPRNVSDEFLDWQIARFEAAQRGIPAGVLRMVASSGSLTQLPNIEYDAIDPGSLLFGSDTWATSRIPFAVEPVLCAVKSRIVQVKELGHTPFPDQAPFRRDAGMRIGILPLGIRDGMPRLHAGRVLVRGREAAVVGMPSLEHTRVDVTAIPDAAVGDEAVIIGRQGDRGIPVEAALHHNQHRRLVDLMMAIESTLPRVAVGSDP